jgi:hypothetical protein
MSVTFNMNSFLSLGVPRGPHVWRSEAHRDIFGKSRYEGKGKDNFKYILNK